MHPSGRPRLLRAGREAATVPRLSEWLELPRLREDLPRHSSADRAGALNKHRRLQTLRRLPPRAGDGSTCRVLAQVVCRFIFFAAIVWFAGFRRVSAGFGIAVF